MMKTLRTYGSWMLALAFVTGSLAGCPKPEEKKDDKKTESADKKSDKKEDKADKKADDKADKKADDKADKKADDKADKKADKKADDTADKGDDEKKEKKAKVGEKKPEDKAEKKTLADQPDAPKGAKKNSISDKLPAEIAKKPVPKDWDRFYDDIRKYEFQCPTGSTYKDGELDATFSSDGKLSYWDIDPPAPYEFNVEFIAFKDKDLTQDDLIEDAQAWLESDEAGAKSFKITDTKQVNGRSKIAHYTFTTKDGQDRKGDLLVFTDVTDNYLMFIDIDAAKYAANADTMDAIWQSFGIYGRDYD